jgi:hypothetical protein
MPQRRPLRFCAPLAIHAREAPRVDLLSKPVAANPSYSFAARDGKEPVVVFAGALRPWHGVALTDVRGVGWGRQRRSRPGAVGGRGT